MLLFLRIASCPAEMQIKIKKEGEEIFSATRGISYFDFPRSSIIKRGNKHGQRYFIRKSKHKAAYGWELDGLGVKNVSVKLRTSVLGSTDQPGGCNTSK